MLNREPAPAPSPRLLREDMARVMDECLMPWLRAPGARRILLAEALHQTGATALPANVTVTRHAAPPLATGRKPQGYLQLVHWPDRELHASRFPTIIFVIEGEADMRFGTPVGYAVVGVPAPTMAVVPPGVPYGDGSRGHWERPHPERARARVLSINVLPEATLCHTCSTIGTRHTQQTMLAVADAQMTTIAQLLIDELRGTAPHREGAIDSLLILLLLRIARGLTDAPDEVAEQAARPAQVAHPAQVAPAAPSVAATLDRACRYIETHLHEALSPDLIATHAFASTSQLKRVFRSELDTSIMRWVLDRRLAAAQSLLENTSVPVQEVARYVGFEHAPHFSASFTQHVGVTPREYRRRRVASSPKVGVY